MKHPLFLEIIIIRRAKSYPLIIIPAISTSAFFFKTKYPIFSINISYFQNSLWSALTIKLNNRVGNINVLPLRNKAWQENTVMNAE
jgi:hypothetical protein